MPYLSIQIIAGEGYTIPSVGDYMVEPDSTHTITAIPYEGYIFDHFTVIGGPQHGTHTENPVTVTVEDGYSTMVYVSFVKAPKPASPAHVVMQSYEWRFEPSGVFSYRPDDVRSAWKLVFTVINIGEQPSEWDATVYIRNAPQYIGTRIAYGHFPRLDPGRIDTRSFTVPETKGGEYYELEITTTSTRNIERYSIGQTPLAMPVGVEVEEAWIPPPPVAEAVYMPTPEEKPVEKPSLGLPVLLVLAGLVYWGWRRRSSR